MFSLKGKTREVMVNPKWITYLEKHGTVILSIHLINGKEIQLECNNKNQRNTFFRILAVEIISGIK